MSNHMLSRLYNQTDCIIDFEPGANALFGIAPLYPRFSPAAAIIPGVISRLPKLTVAVTVVTVAMTLHQRF